jgi:hypothetical protein
MKKLLLVAACIVATVGALAQGQVNFNNTGPAIGGTGAPVFDTDGTTLLAGTDYLAQLYAGPDAGSLAAVGVATAFRTGAGAGFIVGGTVATPSVAPGAAASVQMRAWKASDGATFEAAQAAGLWGMGNIISVTTGGAGVPPSLPANLTGLTSFSLVPEPSTIALLALGAAALFLRRRN